MLLEAVADRLVAGLGVVGDLEAGLGVVRAADLLARLDQLQHRGDLGLAGLGGDQLGAALDHRLPRAGGGVHGHEHAQGLGVAGLACDPRGQRMAGLVGGALLAEDLDQADRRGPLAVAVAAADRRAAPALEAVDQVGDQLGADDLVRALEVGGRLVLGADDHAELGAAAQELDERALVERLPVERLGQLVDRGLVLAGVRQAGDQLAQQDHVDRVDAARLAQHLGGLRRVGQALGVQRPGLAQQADRVGRLDRAVGRLDEQLGQRRPVLAGAVPLLEAPAQLVALGRRLVAALEHAGHAVVVAELVPLVGEAERALDRLLAGLDRQQALGDLGALARVVVGVQQRQQRLDQLAVVGREVEGRAVHRLRLVGLGPAVQVAEAQRRGHDRLGVARLLGGEQLLGQELDELGVVAGALEHLGEQALGLLVAGLLGEDVLEQADGLGLAGHRWRAGCGPARGACRCAP
jgi:hypothetical protein